MKQLKAEMTMSELNKLHDALERQSEIIAALRNEIALLKAKNAEQMKTIVALIAKDANHE